MRNRGNCLLINQEKKKFNLTWIFPIGLLMTSISFGGCKFAEWMCDVVLADLFNKFSAFFFKTLKNYSIWFLKFRIRILKNKFKKKRKQKKIAFETRVNLGK